MPKIIQRVWLYDVEFLEFVKIRKDWRREEKGMTQDEMVGWHHWLNGHEFEQAPGVGDRQEGLACCSPWGCKGLDTTETLNWTERLWTCTQWFLKIIWSIYSLIIFSNCFYFWRLELNLIFQPGNLNFSSVLGNSNVAIFLYLFSSSVNSIGHMLLMSHSFHYPLNVILISFISICLCMFWMFL